MTKKLEETFGLPSIEEALKEQGMDIELSDDELERYSKALEETGYNTLDNMSDPDGTIAHAQEMDEIYDTAMRIHKDSADLAFNIEAKHAGSLLDSSARYLEISLKASQSKQDSRLKAIKLMIEKERLESKLKLDKTDGVIENTVDGNSFVASRNDLIKKIKDDKKK